MKKIYYLSTCNTCKRIIEELKAESSFILQDIKKQSLTEDELDQIMQITGSYESLFNKRAIKFRKIKEELKNPTEKNYKELLLAEYTFLKRPLVQINNQIFAGNAKSTVEAAKKELRQISDKQ